MTNIFLVIINVISKLNMQSILYKPADCVSFDWLLVCFSHYIADIGVTKQILVFNILGPLFTNTKL